MSMLTSLDLIATFQAVMHTGSLSAAARDLQLSQPTVRRHIETLEATLNARLFSRASNGLTPTPMAREILPLAQAVGTQADAFMRAASSAAESTAGRVRLTASRMLSTHVLPQLLPGLARHAPDIELELTSTDATENMARRAADVAIRLAPPEQTTLLAQKLPAIKLGLFAAPTLDLDEQTLQSVPFISDDRHRRIEPALEAIGHPGPGKVVLRTDDDLAQVGAIQAGLGVGICQIAIGQRLGLRRVFAPLETEMPCYLVMHEDQKEIRRIRLVFEYLAQHLPHVL